MAGSGQRAHKEKSGGMRIDDHRFFAGKTGGQMVAPEGVHVKGIRDSSGMGELMNYEDTEERIHAQQEEGVRKQKAHAQRPLFRN